MKIFQMNVSRATLAQLAADGHALSTFGSIKDSQDLVDVMDSEECELLLVDLAVSQWIGHFLPEIRQKGLKVPIVGIEYCHPIDWSKRCIAFLDAGGDSLVRGVAPPQEVAAVVRALLRRHIGRTSEQKSLTSQYADLEVCFRQKRVWVNGKLLSLTAFEMRILLFLVENAGAVCSRTVIAESLYNHDCKTNTNIIDVFMTKLRKKMEVAREGASRILETVRGIGYRLDAD